MNPSPLANLLEHARREASASYRRNPPRGITEAQHIAEVQVIALQIRAVNDPIARLQLQALGCTPITD